MARRKKDGKFVNFYIREDLVKLLDGYCDITLLPKTAVVEKALDEYFASHFPAGLRKNVESKTSDILV